MSTKYVIHIDSKTMHFLFFTIWYLLSFFILFQMTFY